MNTVIKEVEEKVAEAAKTFHAVETKVLQEVIDFLTKQPFESVNGILVKLSQNTKPVQLMPVPITAPKEVLEPVAETIEPELPLEVPATLTTETPAQ